MLKPILVTFLVVLLGACNEYTPKPVGYSRIERSSDFYKLFETDYFSFLYSDQAYIDTVYSKTKSDLWFNIVYPDYKAKIYCSYFPITKQTLNQALEDSYHLAYTHAIKANGINQTVYNNLNNNTSGIIYDIHGNVATPIQFFLTDSTSNFFRASFYFDQKVKSDSVSPFIEIVREDILKLIESFEWK